MQPKIVLFTEKLKLEKSNKISSIYLIGSNRGEADISIADLDLLIISKRKSETKNIFFAAQKIAEEIYNTKTTKINSFIQRNFLGSNDYKGIHVIVLGEDEFSEDFKPLSIRLKILSLFFGHSLFLEELKHNIQLLFGKNFIETIPKRTPDISDKIACFLLPMIILIIIIPEYFLSINTFKIWVFKVIKYHFTNTQTLIRLNGGENFKPSALPSLAHAYRYSPESYTLNSAKLYFATWTYIFSHISILFNKNLK